MVLAWPILSLQGGGCVPAFRPASRRGPWWKHNFRWERASLRNKSSQSICEIKMTTSSFSLVVSREVQSHRKNGQQPSSDVRARKYGKYRTNVSIRTV